MNDYSNATQSIQAAVDSWAGDEFSGLFDAYFYLGWLYDLLGNEEAALSATDKAVELDPNNSAIYVNRALLLAEKDMESANEDLETAIHLDPKNGTAYHNLGMLAYIKGDLENAVRYYSKAIELDPDLFASYINRGNILDYQGKTDEAIRDYNAAIKIYPNFSDAYYNRAVAYKNKGDYEATLQDLDQAIELDSSNISAYISRGDLHMQQENYVGATSDFTSAINVSSNIEFGTLWREHRDFGDQFSSLYYDWPPDLGELYYKRGLAYYNLTESDSKAIENAISDFSQTIDFYPDDKETTKTRLADIHSILEGAHAKRGELRLQAKLYQDAIVDFTAVIKMNDIPEFECTMFLGEPICPNGKGADGKGELIFDGFLSNIFNMMGMARR